MSTFEQYQNTKAQNTAIFNASLLLASEAQQLDDYQDSVIQQELLKINDSIQAISAWLETKSQEALLESFLIYQKDIMQDYGLEISVVDSNGGYGQNWGEGSVPAIKFKISKDGYVSEKVYTTLPVTQENV